MQADDHEWLYASPINSNHFISGCSHLLLTGITWLQGHELALKLFVT